MTSGDRAEAQQPAAEHRVGTAAVFLNGEYMDEEFDRRLAACCGLLLAADGGAARLAALGLRPDAVVGDMDSLADATARELRSAGVDFVTHPVRKDKTDGELAVEHALARGATAVLLAGALGTQLDHVLGHVAILRRAAALDIDVCLVGPQIWARAVCGPAEVSLAGPIMGRRFSLVPLTTQARVSLSGFDYELDDRVVRADSCLGLGNTVTAGPALVDVHDGTALLILSADGLAVRAGRAPATA